MKITRKSVISGIERVKDIPVNPEHFIQWVNGAGSIQDIMPYLNTEDREFILSGIVQKEWDDAFKADINL